VSTELVTSKLLAIIDGVKIHARVFEAVSSTPHKTGFTLFCLPGGGVSAEIYDLAPSYSFARNMVQKGYRVIAMDHLGTATNPLPANHPFLRPEHMAAYMGKALKYWQNVGDLPSGTLIGLGHSMGGLTQTLIQASYTPFKALIFFGASAGGLDWGLSDHEKTYIEAPLKFAEDIEMLAIGKFGAEFTKVPSGPSGKSITFGGETPELTQRLREVSCELYAAGGLMSMVRGSFRQQVESINIPMFFAFGDHDIGIAPQDAPKAYINAQETAVIVLKNTGHNHFAFSSLHTLCEKIDKWLTQVLAC